MKKTETKVCCRSTTLSSAFAFLRSQCVIKVVLGERPFKCSHHTTDLDQHRDCIIPLVWFHFLRDLHRFSILSGMLFITSWSFGGNVEPFTAILAMKRFREMAGGCLSVASKNCRWHKQLGKGVSCEPKWYTPKIRQCGYFGPNTWADPEITVLRLSFCNRSHIKDISPVENSTSKQEAF